MASRERTYRSEAIVLRRSDFGEADRLLTLYTRDYGKIRAIAKGTDGSNVHLGGPETIAGYFGGVGQPNEYALKWLDEYLHYSTNYCVRQLLNINPGTVLVGYMLHRLGVDIQFKISVFMGNDNPYAAFWILIGAKLFSRNDGSSPLVGFNWSNSVNNETMEITS